MTGIVQVGLTGLQSDDHLIELLAKIDLQGSELLVSVISTIPRQIEIVRSLKTAWHVGS